MRWASRQRVADDSSSQTITKLDSLNNMSLMVLLEETRGISFQVEEITMPTSVGAAPQILRDKVAL